MNNSQVDPKAYRQTIGAFTTGVTVITAGSGDQIRGMTANAVTSVSLSPTLLLFCVKKNAQMVAVLKKESCFTINILCEDQQALSNHFAGMQESTQAIDFIPWQAGVRLGGCGAAIGCRLYARHDGGDHWIILGQVIALHRPTESFRPLVFYSGQYGNLAPAA
jgi:flavin reductase (DIM6/NTAB) family NADH-FMN oxidoreductase RutF